MTAQARIFAALVAVSLGLGRPNSSLAQTPVTDQDSISGTSESCRAYNAARRYAESLPICLAAAQAYRRTKDRVGYDAWSVAYNQADVLMFAAADRSGLSLHAEALQTALAAHRLVMNIGENFALTGADKLRVVMLARQLEVLETNESIYLRARATPVASKRSVAKPSAAPPHY